MLAYHVCKLITLFSSCIIFLLILPDNINGTGSITEVTSSVGLQNVDGVVSAFCDFDSDRDTDLVMITTSGNP